MNIALKHMQEDLPSLREFNPSIPQSVENIIIKATAKNLNDRYKSATEMLEDLQTCLSRTDEEKLVFDHSDEVNDPTIVVNPRQIFDEEEPEEVEERAVEKKNNNGKGKQILEKLKNPKVFAGVVAGVVLIIGIICYFLLFGGNKQPNVMPDLVGLKQSEAEKILKDYDVTINKTVFKELSDDYKKGLITKTDPEKGSSIKEGDVITITVSKGKYIVLDNYTGLSYDEAKKKLNKIGFKVDIKREVSDKKAGTVLEQSLEKGYKQDPTDKDRTITLTISKGSYVILDDYTGMSYDDAYNKLSGLGFNVTKREQTSDQPAGTVIDQNLAKGYKVDPTDTNRNITLTVSTGYSQTVPSVVGLTPDSAKSNLENLGFTVSMEGTQFPESGGDERYIGAVYKQSIAAGTKVDKKGTTITIYYYED